MVTGGVAERRGYLVWAAYILARGHNAANQDWDVIQNNWHERYPRCAGLIRLPEGKFQEEVPRKVIKFTL